MQHDSSRSVAPLPLVVGIDVSKATLDCYLDPSGRRLTLSNDERDIASLLDHLRPHAIQLVLLEATGRLHRRLAAELLQASIPVALVNPQRSREYAKSIGRLEKTDRVDAEGVFVDVGDSTFMLRDEVFYRHGFLPPVGPA